MFKELIDRASHFLDEELPFALYSKPNSGILNAIFQNDDEIHFVKDFTETGFVFAPFDVASNAILLKSDEMKTVPIEVDVLPWEAVKSEVILNQADKEQHIDLITKALEKIQEGSLNKVVLSRKIEVNCKLTSTLLFQRMLKMYPKAFCYLWHHPKVGTWIGATPEILIKSKGQEFTTMSLAGTQSSSEFETPQWTQKELHEQQLVTDYILETLKAVDVTVENSELESVQAGSLWHLRTELKGRFAPNTFEKVVKAIHPTPAVCGTPLEAAANFIKKNESYDRAFYTGFLGELNFKAEVSRNRNQRNQENSVYRSVMQKSELFVNLRCMQ